MTQLVQEAVRELGERRQIGCIVSIGTGKRKVSGFQKPSPGFERIIPRRLIHVPADMATDSEVKAMELAERYKNLPGLYHRLNVDRGLEDVSLNEWGKLGEVKTHTMAYLTRQEISREVDEIVRTLVGRPDHTFPLNQLGS